MEHPVNVITTPSLQEVATAIAVMTGQATPPLPARSVPSHPFGVMVRCDDEFRLRTICAVGGSSASGQGVRAIAAAVSGTSYYDHVRRHVLEPARLTDTGFFTKPEVVTDRGVT